MAANYSYQNVADELGITVGGVKRHIHNIKQKLFLDDLEQLKEYYFDNFQNIG